MASNHSAKGETIMDTARDYPAINGETVTERHANYCERNGHAKHTVNGHVSPLCPRCGSARQAIAPDYYGVRPMSCKAYLAGIDYGTTEDTIATYHSTASDATVAAIVHGATRSRFSV